MAESETEPAGTNRASDDGQMLLEFLLNVQRSLDLNEVANVVANDGRLLWGVDRVSVAVCRGQTVKITAVSGQESVHPRGNLVRLMQNVASRVVATGDVLRHDGSPNEIPPQWEAPLAEFIQESGARFVMIVPLLEPERLVPAEAPPGTGKISKVERKAVGALVIEQMQNAEPAPRLQRSLDLVTGHIAASIFNARSHTSLFLLPVWHTMGYAAEWLRGRRLAIAGTIAAALIVGCIALTAVPWEYRVEGSGRLMPVTQRDIFAPWDGQVIELLVEGGERVEAGQILLKLRNDDLAAELVKISNELREKRKLLASLAAQRDDAEKRGDQEQVIQLQGKSAEARVEIEGASLQHEILKCRVDQLTVRAPMAGIVTDFQVDKRLLHRPVKRGDIVLKVMDDRGDWRLELEIAEQRVGRILTAQQDIAASNGLSIEYRLLTRPESSFFAQLSELATRAAATETEGNVVEAWAGLEGNRLPPCTIGAEVRARIGCGVSSLGDVLFGDVIEFIQRYLWW